MEVRAEHVARQKIVRAGIGGGEFITGRQDEGSEADGQGHAPHAERIPIHDIQCQIVRRISGRYMNVTQVIVIGIQ